MSIEYGSAEQILYLQASILTELNTRCGLTQFQVTEMVQKSNMLKYIAENYDLYHIESTDNALEDIQKYVKDFGFTFEIKYDN